MALPDDVKAVLTERLGIYEFPASFHGDRRSLKLTTIQAVEVILDTLHKAGYAVVKGSEPDEDESPIIAYYPTEADRAHVNAVASYVCNCPKCNAKREAAP